MYLEIYQTRFISCSHIHVLDEDNERPDSQSSLFSKALEKDLSHGLRAGHERLKISSHAEREGHVDC
jgi:hypothetical protein